MQCKELVHGGPAPPQPVPIPNQNIQYTNSALPSTNAVSHNHVQSGSVSPTSSAMYGVMTETKQVQPTAKLYCLVTWRILTHALLLYAVFGVTYLFFNPTNNDCPCTNTISSGLELSDTSNAPTATPVELPTKSPSKMPSQSPIIVNAEITTKSTESPTKIPTKMPSLSPTSLPTKLPSESPTPSPTISPTE